MKALVVRDAAIGDLIMATPLFRGLAARGYQVHAVVKKAPGDAVLPLNPHVHKLHLLEAQPTMADRTARITRIADRIEADLVIDLAGTCENRFLFSASSQEYNFPLEWRRANAAGHNYYDYQAQIIGEHAYRGELFVSEAETQWWTKFRSNMLGWRIVQLQLTGSSICKAYPYWPQVIKGLHEQRRQTLVMLTGDPGLGQLLGLGAVEAGADPRRIWQTCGDKKMGLRDSLVATAFVDLVIGPETGVLNAAGCFDTPKVLLLSHSGAEQISAGWSNCIALHPTAKCAPCYRLVTPGAPCDIVTEDEDEDIAGAARCMATISPDAVLGAARLALQKKGTTS